MVYIYTLQLENGKYYVGKTNNPQFRIQNHIHNKASAWTSLHKPIKVLELISDCDDYDEDKYTRVYMDKYGIQNVRGGSFVSVKLDDATIKQLTKMRNGTNNNCFNCGNYGHFANKCNNTKKNYHNKIHSDSRKKFKNATKCFSCGRFGHYASVCYLKKLKSKSYLN